MVAFPTNIRYLDAASFSEEFENTSLPPAEMEGGYTITRPRFTRTPRRTFRFRFREMFDADKAILQAHWVAMKGSSMLFTWTHPVSAQVVTVRFGKDMTSLKFSRVGFGPLNVWETDAITFEEV